MSSKTILTVNTHKHTSVQKKLFLTHAQFFGVTLLTRHAQHEQLQHTHMLAHTHTHAYIK